MAQIDPEHEFGWAFERFYEALEDLVGLLREALPAVLKQHDQWSDVRNLAPTLKIAPDRVDEFVAIWEDSFGTKEFRAILPEAPPTDTGGEDDDDAGHEAAKQPERDAHYASAVTTFIFDNGSFLDLQRVMRQYWRSSQHILTMAKSSIVFAIGALESAVADIERVRLHSHIGAAGTKDKEFSLDDLLRLNDIDSVVEEAVERRVENLCYGSLDDWNDWFRRAFGSTLESLALDWATMREIIQRRHAIAHNNGRVSRLYLERTGLKDSELQVGSYLPLTPGYVFDALDATTVLGVRMLVHAWRKLGDNEEHVLLHLRNKAYDSLVAERWHLTTAIAQEILAVAPEGSSEALLARVNSWLAQVGLGQDIEEAVATWDVTPLALRFKVAKAALLDDFDALTHLIPEALAAGEFGRSELLTWPLFRSLRSQPMFAGILTSLDPE